MKKIAIASYRQNPVGSSFNAKQDLINELYTSAIFASGGLPYIIPYTKPVDCEAIIEGFDGLLIPGGGDISPQMYGGENRLSLNIDNDEDRYQLSLISSARKHHIPIYGICRGLQLINVSLGGTLYQDLKTDMKTELEHIRVDIPSGHAHTVKLSENSELKKLFKRDEIEVNSLHHQGIERLGFGLRATATATDGLIEAIEGKGIFAVQWHPEAMSREEMGVLFDYIVKTAGAGKKK